MATTSKRSPLSFSLDTQTSTPVAPAIKEPEPPKIKEPRVPVNSRAGRHFIAAHVLPEAAKQFKLLALQQDKTTKTLLIEAINDLFAKYGMSRIADE